VKEHLSHSFSGSPIGIRQSEKLHRETLRNISDTVLITRKDGTLSYVCPNVERIFGYSVEEIERLGSISEFLDTDPAEGCDLEIGEEIFNVEQSVVDASGDRHDLLVNVRGVSIREGRRMYTCFDITDRKAAGHELRRSQERYRSLFRDSNNAILVHDLEGRIQ